MNPHICYIRFAQREPIYAHGNNTAFPVSRQPTADPLSPHSLAQEDVYLINCIRYVELNPVRAGITTDPGDYRWSSYRCHAFGNTAWMWAPCPEYLCLGENETERQKTYREMIAQSLSAEVIQKIRHCLNTGLVLGTAAFRDQVNALRR